MKKSILLATTALISAFALNANAASVQGPKVDLRVKLAMISPVSASCTQDLDFGILASSSGSATTTITPAGTVQETSGYHMQFGTVKNGIVTITSGGSDISGHIRLDLPDSIPLSGAGGCSGKSITNLTQGDMVFDSSSQTYMIAFGGKFTGPTTVAGESYPGAKAQCTGSAQATLVWTE